MCCSLFWLGIRCNKNSNNNRFSINRFWMQILPRLIRYFHWNENAFCRNTATTMLLSLVAPSFIFPHQYIHNNAHTHTQTHTEVHRIFVGRSNATIPLCIEANILDPLWLKCDSYAKKEGKTASRNNIAPKIENIYIDIDRKKRGKKVPRTNFVYFYVNIHAFSFKCAMPSSSTSSFIALNTWAAMVCVNVCVFCLLLAQPFTRCTRSFSFVVFVYISYVWNCIPTYMCNMAAHNALHMTNATVVAHMKLFNFHFTPSFKRIKSTIHSFPYLYFILFKKKIIYIYPTQCEREREFEFHLKRWRGKKLFPRFHHFIECNSKPEESLMYILSVMLLCTCARYIDYKLLCMRDTERTHRNLTRTHTKCLMAIPIWPLKNFFLFTIFLYFLLPLFGKHTFLPRVSVRNFNQISKYSTFFLRPYRIVVCCFCLHSKYLIYIY